MEPTSVVEDQSIKDEKTVVFNTQQSDSLSNGKKDEATRDIAQTKSRTPESPFELFTGIEDQKAANRCLKEPVNNADQIVDKDLPPTDLLPIPNAYMARVSKNQRITATDHFQDVRHVSLNILPTRRFPGNYGPGDIVTLYPKNFPSDVESLIKLQGWEAFADEPLHTEYYKSRDRPQLVQPRIANYARLQPCTLRSLLLHSLDITAVPRRAFFDQISHFTKDMEHKEKLRDFSNPVYTDEFFDYTTRPRRTILEVLHDFPSVKIPFQYALLVFPPLRGRQFSIASGGTQVIDPFIHNADDSNAIRVDLAVALVQYTTTMKKVRHGVCSRWLSNLPIGTKIAITFTRGNYPKIPMLFFKPIIMIAPGTGVAPMRSLINAREEWIMEKEREYIIRLNDHIENNTDKAPEPWRFPPAWLIFGNRHSRKDFLFDNEFQSPATREHLELSTAWSRQYPRGDKRNIYVQDVIRERAKDVFKYLVTWGGTVFVCGSSGNMPKGVRLAIAECVAHNLQMTVEEAEKYVDGLEKQGRYVQETW